MIASLSARTAAPAPSGDSIVMDVDIHNFMTSVIEGSKQALVIVDFWAPWCGPCKQLGPVLEKLVRAQGGAVRLAKIDIDQNPEIAGQMRVQSIPAVFAFYQGQPVDGFMGALPESQIASWIEKLMKALKIQPGTGEDVDHSAFLLAAADEALAAGQWDDAHALYQEILAAQPDDAAAYCGIVRVLMAQGAMDQARAMIQAASADIAKTKDMARIKTQMDLMETANAAAAGRAAFEMKLAANPDDHAARFDLAMALFASDDRQGAVDALLEIVRRNRSWNDDAARKQLVKFFESFGPTDPLTIETRKRLSSILFS